MYNSPMTTELLNKLEEETTRVAAANIYNDLYRLLFNTRVIRTTINVVGKPDGINTGIPSGTVEMLKVLALGEQLPTYLDQLENQSRDTELPCGWQAIGKISRQRLEDALKQL